MRICRRQFWQRNVPPAQQVKVPRSCSLVVCKCSATRGRSAEARQESRRASEQSGTTEPIVGEPVGQKVLKDTEVTELTNRDCANARNVSMPQLSERQFKTPTHAKRSTPHRRPCMHSCGIYYIVRRTPSRYRANAQYASRQRRSTTCTHTNPLRSLRTEAGCEKRPVVKRNTYLRPRLRSSWLKVCTYNAHV